MSRAPPIPASAAQATDVSATASDRLTRLPRDTGAHRSCIEASAAAHGKRHDAR
jgi:hypothetical protein